MKVTFIPTQTVYPMLSIEAETRDEQMLLRLFLSRGRSHGGDATDLAVVGCTYRDGEGPINIQVNWTKHT